MKHIDWDELKNDKLMSERSVCFEDVVAAIDDRRVLADHSHPNQDKYSHQKILVVEINHYVYLVPYVEDEQKIFLKTIIPSRKATKIYLHGDSV